MSLRKLRGAANSDAVVERTTAVTPQQSHRSRPASQQVEPRPGAVLLADLGELLGPPVMPAADPQAAAEIWNLEDDRLGVQRAVAGAADDVLLRHRYPHGPYSMLGPVEVAGAEPGDVIEVSITALRTIRWAWNSFPLGVGALPHDFAEPYLHYFTFDDARTTADFAHGITLPMAPFLGVVAAEPAGDAPVSAIVSGGYGGNLVLRDLGVGSHLFLPVARPGGRVWIGDVHALQGDGVVDQTAIETAAEDLDIRYDLH